MLKDHNTFEIIFLAGFIAGSLMRKVYMKKHRDFKALKKYSNIPDLVLVGAGGVGLAMPLLYFFTSSLDFANYNLPVLTGWVGTVFFTGAIVLLWRSHVDLGNNWSATLRITGQHSLVTDGIYRYIRHPMYTAHLLWAIAQGLLLSNWFAGWAFLVLSVPLYIIRIPREEQMMLEHFGEEYSLYKGRTGRLIPRMYKKDVC
ncbi:MAG: protein-S-isoprenylcysteine O-methyltransferase [Planctomycetota bacterium]